MADFSRNISVIKDCDNKKIVVINDIIFKGKQIKDIYNAKEDSYTYSEKLVNPFHREHNWKKDIL